MKQLHALAPYFLVKDLLASVEYYHTALGFTRPKLWGVPPGFAMPQRDGLTVMLKQAEPGWTILPNASQEHCWDGYFWVEGLDELFAEMKANGAIIEYGVCIQEDYGMKEFAVRDPDGYVLAFGEQHEA